MDEHEPYRSPFSRPGFIASAVMLGMLVLAALFITIGAATRHSSRAPAATAVSGPARGVAGATGATRAARTGCSLPAGVQTVPTVPPVARWVTVGEMQVPQAPSVFGPQRTVDGIGVCFAHDPTGALLAAINVFAEATVANPVLLLRTLTAPTPDQQVAITQAEDGDSGLLQATDGDPGSIALAGFLVVDYTPAEANLDVVLEGPGGELASVQCQLLWQHGDWKFVVPPGEQAISTPVTSLYGFITWTPPDAGGT